MCQGIQSSVLELRRLEGQPKHSVVRIHRAICTGGEADSWREMATSWLRTFVVFKHVVHITAGTVPKSCAEERMLKG